MRLMTSARLTQDSTLVALTVREGRLAWTSSAAPRREWDLALALDLLDAANCVLSLRIPGAMKLLAPRE